MAVHPSIVETAIAKLKTAVSETVDGLRDRLAHLDDPEIDAVIDELEDDLSAIAFDFAEAVVV